MIWEGQKFNLVDLKKMRLWCQSILNLRGERAPKKTSKFSKNCIKRLFFDMFFFPQLCLRRRNFCQTNGGLYSDLGESKIQFG